MEINKNMQDAINRQINRELYSSYLYLSMAAQFEVVCLRGFAKWMKKQSEEEYGHAMKLYDYLIQRGGKVILAHIEKPPSEWMTPLEVFEYAYKHEKHVTEMIHDLANTAMTESDQATSVFLHWFINEQVEEEAVATEILQKLKMAGESSAALLLLDKELGERK